jgi:hypothetical protein
VWLTGLDVAHLRFMLTSLPLDFDHHPRLVLSGLESGQRCDIHRPRIANLAASLSIPTTSFVFLELDIDRDPLEAKAEP